jgi:hypothetical protein
MKRLKKELQAVSKELKALVNKTEKLMKAFDKLEQAPAAEKKKTKVKAKKAPAKETAAKKATGPTATEQVVSLIKRSKKGVDIPTLVEKTGFEDKKIRNIVFRALKQGKIERAARGVYTGTRETVRQQDVGFKELEGLRLLYSEHYGL